MPKKALGKGIGAIFADDMFVGNISCEETLAYIELDLIKPNRYQPRKNFNNDELNELAGSIKESGLLQPITVRPVGKNYEIIAGERRWRASRIAGKASIPVIIKQIDEKYLLGLALVENIQRSALNPVETAMAYNQLIEELGYTQDEVAKKVGKDRSSISNLVRILKLPAEVIDLLEKKALSTGHAKVLLSIDNDSLTIALAHKTVREGLSVRKLEQLMKAAVQSSESEKDDVPVPVPFLETEKKLQAALDSKVKIFSKGKAGRIVINYSSQDNLNRIVELLSD